MCMYFMTSRLRCQLLIMSNGAMCRGAESKTPRTMEIETLKASGMGIRRVFPPQPTRVWVNSPSIIRSRALAAKAFWWIFVCINTSDSSNIRHFCAGKKCWNCSRCKVVPGHNDTFAAVVPLAPWHFFSHCPCGVGTSTSSYSAQVTLCRPWRLLQISLLYVYK